MKAYNFNILLKELKEEVAEEKIGSLVIPGETEEINKHFEVISTGEKVEGIKVGDVVLVRPGMGHLLKNEGTEYLVALDSDVLVIL